MASQANLQPRPRYTAEEYLALERVAEIRSEYLDGEIVAMAGASYQHNQITSNIEVSLNVQLTDRPCTALSGDMRVKVEASNIYYTYPDVVALCGEPRFDDAHLDTLLNPLVLVEVLSASTRSYDQREKSAYYKHIESLTDFLLVDQDRIHVEHVARQDDGRWLSTEYTQSEDTLVLASLGCTLRLADVYRKVRFRESPTDDAAS